MGVYGKQMPRFILKKEKRKGYPSLFVGEGSRERPVSCSFLEGSSLVLKPHLSDSLPKYHRAAERFQSKNQSHFLAQYQSVPNLTHAEAPFNEIPIVNAVLFLLDTRLIWEKSNSKRLQRLKLVQPPVATQVPSEGTFCKLCLI